MDDANKAAAESHAKREDENEQREEGSVFSDSEEEEGELLVGRRDVASDAEEDDEYEDARPHQTSEAGEMFLQRMIDAAVLEYTDVHDSLTPIYLRTTLWLKHEVIALAVVFGQDCNNCYFPSLANEIAKQSRLNTSV